VHEVAAYLHCSPSTIRRMAAAGELPYYRLGRLLRFRRTELDAWLTRRHHAQAPGGQRQTPDPAQLSLFDAAAPD